jgi:hypothetical protein
LKNRKAKRLRNLKKCPHLLKSTCRYKEAEATNAVSNKALLDDDSHDLRCPCAELFKGKGTTTKETGDDAPTDDQRR